MLFHDLRSSGEPPVPKSRPKSAGGAGGLKSAGGADGGGLKSAGGADGGGGLKSAGGPDGGVFSDIYLFLFY